MPTKAKYEITLLPDETYKLRRIAPSEAVLGPFTQKELEEFLAGSISEDELEGAFKKLHKANASLTIEGDLNTPPAQTRSRKRVTAKRPRPKAKKSVTRSSR